MDYQENHENYRRVWQHLFAELFGWSAAETRRWEELRLGSAQPSDSILGVVQHRGASHYVAEVLFPRTDVTDWHERDYNRVLSRLRGVLERAEVAYLMNELSVTEDVLTDLRRILSDSGFDLEVCRRRAPYS